MQTHHFNCTMIVQVHFPQHHTNQTAISQTIGTNAYMTITYTSPYLTKLVSKSELGQFTLILNNKTQVIDLCTIIIT